MGWTLLTGSHGPKGSGDKKTSLTNVVASRDLARQSQTMRFSNLAKIIKICGTDLSGISRWKLLFQKDSKRKNLWR